MLERVGPLLFVFFITSCTSQSTGTGADASTGVEGMLSVPAGTFMMGCNKALDTQCNENPNDNGGDEEPAHSVTVKSFSLDATETTEEAYGKCMAAGACTAPWVCPAGTTCPQFWSAFDPTTNPNLPVAWITWEQAVAYCKWRGMRLPTEAEWEWAARGTDGRVYPWGNDPIDCAHANFTPASGACVRAPEPVGRHPDAKGPYGHLDLAGNLWEWVTDWYDPRYYASSPATDPQGPAASPIGQHSKRGGSWHDPGDFQRTSKRWHHPQDGMGSFDIGVRCARDP